MASYEYPERVVLKITAAPKYGVLKKNGDRLRAGDVIFKEDLDNGFLTYTHTKPSTNIQSEDFFEFGIYQYGELLTGKAYSDCFKVGKQIPDDGIYRYVITIVAEATPIIAPVIDFKVVRGKDKILKLADFNYSFSGQEALYFFTEGKVGFFNNGTPVEMFSANDVTLGKISVRFEDAGTFQFELTIASQHSKHSSSTITVTSIEPLEFVGNNVFYTAILSKVDKTITVNRSDVIFIVEGSTTAPPEGILLTDSDIIEFTEYNDFGLVGAANGPGYNKPKEYRNYENKYYWSDLPKGTSVSSRGRLVSAKHREQTSEGSELWAMPAIPAMYTVNVTALDTVTGERATRPYHIVVTYDGFGPEGQEEEIL